METATPSPTSVRMLRFAGYAAAVAGAWYALGGTFAVSEAVARFGWQRLLIVHLVMALPLCVLAASTIQRHIAAAHRRFALSASMSLAILAMLGVTWLLPFVARAFADADLSLWAGVVLRSLLCAILLLPSCVTVETACSEFIERSEQYPCHTTQPTSRAAGWWASLGLLSAIAIPGAYAQRLCQRQTALAVDLLQRQELVVAERLVHRLCAVGSDATLGSATPQLVARNLSHAIAALEERIANTLQEPLDPARTIERARALAMLDRLSAAQNLIAPLAEFRPEAALLLATILQQEEAWQQSSQWYDKGLQLLRAMPDSRERTAGLVQSLDGLAFNAREMGHYREAEDFYAAGLRDLPEAAAHFHFQLGRQHHAGGRPLAAIAHLQQAAELDAKNYAAQTGAIIRQLAAGSPGCLLGPAAPGSRHQTAP